MSSISSILAAVSLAALATSAALLAASCRKEPPPVAAPAATPRLIPPLHDATVGEWLRIETDRDALMYRVVDAGDYWVDVETLTYRDQAQVGAPLKQRWWRNSFGLPEDECVIRAIDSDRIQIGDKWFDCWRLFVTSRSGQEKYFWISDQVAVHGLLKVASLRKGIVDEAHAAKLAEWGVSGNDERGK